MSETPLLKIRRPPLDRPYDSSYPGFNASAGDVDLLAEVDLKVWAYSVAMSQFGGMPHVSGYGAANTYTVPPGGTWNPVFSDGPYLFCPDRVMRPYYGTFAASTSNYPVSTWGLTAGAGVSPVAGATSVTSEGSTGSIAVVYARQVAAGDHTYVVGGVLSGTPFVARDTADDPTLKLFQGRMVSSLFMVGGSVGSPCAPALYRYNVTASTFTRVLQADLPASGYVRAVGADFGTTGNYCFVVAGAPSEHIGWANSGTNSGAYPQVALPAGVTGAQVYGVYALSSNSFLLFVYDGADLKVYKRSSAGAWTSHTVGPYAPATHDLSASPVGAAVPLQDFLVYKLEAIFGNTAQPLLVVHYRAHNMLLVSADLGGSWLCSPPGWLTTPSGEPLGYFADTSAKLGLYITPTGYLAAPRVLFG